MAHHDHHHHRDAIAQQEHQKAVARRAARRSTWIALGVLVMFFAAPKVLGTLIGIAIVLAIFGLPVYALWRVVASIRAKERQRRESAERAEQQARALRIDALERELGIGWYGIGRDKPLGVPQAIGVPQPLEVPRPPDV